jgi:hypothetical protein
MDPNYRIKLEFTVDEMNQIFKFLGTAPYDAVHGLMQNLKDQIDPQLIPLDEMNENSELTPVNIDHPL